MAQVFDEATQTWVEDGSTAAPAPTGTTYNLGSGPTVVDTSTMNLNDPNQIMAAGLNASQITTQPYEPIVTGVQNNDGVDITRDITSELYNQTVDPHLDPQTTFGYVPVDPNAPGNTLTNNTYVQNATAPNQLQAVAAVAPNMQGYGPSLYDATMADYAQGTVDPNSLYSATYMNAAQGTVDPNSLYKADQMDAAQMQHTNEMDVQYQFDQLMQDDQDGNGVPDWSQTAVTQSQQSAAAMGLGNSTMALNATSTAIYNVALPMAQMNAQTAYNIAATNTANVQAANMANSAAINASKQYNASIFANTQALNTQLLQDANKTNAQYANEASAYNAAVYSQMSLQNLLNQQQTLLSNQAADNAAKQFNASSQMQTDQFFASLNASINQQNADRATATSQFNAGQYNSMMQYYDNLNSQLDMFNAQNQLIIDQSNVEWQRSVNTANTAGINSANNANVQNLFNMQQSDMNMIWQQARDEASWAVTSAENAQNRELSLTSSAMNRETSIEIMDSQQQAATMAAVGSLTASVLTPVVSAGVDSLTSSSPSSSSSGDGGDYGGPDTSGLDTIV